MDWCETQKRVVRNFDPEICHVLVSLFNVHWKSSAGRRNNISHETTNIFFFKLRTMIEVTKQFAKRWNVVAKQLVPLCTVSLIMRSLPGALPKSLLKTHPSQDCTIICTLILWNPKENNYEPSKMQPLCFSQSDRISVPFKRRSFPRSQDLAVLESTGCELLTVVLNLNTVVGP